ncbi:MAG: hypothetical protein Q7V05_11290 [Methanoregula sp.]|nr:hypothetical protein [Methanoregula sp.]
MKKTFTVSQNSTQEAIDSHEQKTSFPGIRNIIVAEEAIDVHEQNPRFPGFMSIDSQGFMDPRNLCHAIARSREISYIRFKIPSAERISEIISHGKGVPA